ncbi:histidinol-phosphate aminotransferase family protein [Olivibacter sp. SDN3]|uniref:pyridoxal phosphate-dependent aminotransferase n=1 Tax=Olivibacter sp. SDN3 TaxID=2764720 RepID=UPI0016517082|nr:histidinol-phosphate transaminase [Olivibacter sp. SDN3]QNL49353.1 histidinol-phosphate aminotransferase family protein [Olivibacter sp. SDN3]
MSTKINRRNWLKSSLMAASSLTLAPNLAWSSSTKKAYGSVIWEIEHPSYYRDSAPALKAKLNANENPYGPSESVKRAINEAISVGNRYGHSDAAVLIDMIAEKEGVTPDHIMLGPGSTDLLEKTAISRFMKGGNIVSADPSYMSLINTAQAIGADWKAVPLTEDYAHDLPAMETAVDSKTQLVYICNPNNPTGSLTEPNALRDFCSKVSEKAPVFVDEAYLEFLDDPEANSMVDLVAKGKDVIVARTFSKIHSMAGLRIGYVVATPERIKSITDMVRSTMGLCVTSIKGALASMADGDFCAECKTLNTAARNYVCTELDQMGYKYIPSYTNFVIFPLHKDTLEEDFMKSMTDNGVGVRLYSFNDEPWCRVSIGTMPEMELFTNVFKRVTA